MATPTTRNIKKHIGQNLEPLILTDYKIVKIIKLKDVSFDVNASALNAADKLNELEWKDYANSTYVAFQTYIENMAGGSRWDEWKPKGISGSPELALTGEKKKSVCTFEDFNSENNNSSLRWSSLKFFRILGAKDKKVVDLRNASFNFIG